MTREEIIRTFNPNAPGTNGTLFGLPFDEHTAQIIVVPVPWEVTVSYHEGTARGPEAILEASAQVDLYDRNISNAWQIGIALAAINEKLKEDNRKLRETAALHIQSLTSETADVNTQHLDAVNQGCEEMVRYVKQTTRNYLAQGKMVAVLGGDHSTPLGFIQALSEQHDRFSILQIDAHADLRKAYEGFIYSHASIMYNALKLPAVNRLIQVGIRDFCEEEVQVIERSMGRIKTFYDEDIKNSMYEGRSWQSLCNDIIQELNEKVYISFDIDGLNPSLCPNTGTPVAGGLEFHQVLYLLRKLVESGKKIIGFDLNEVAPGESDWDANVGARLLYQLCNWMAVSQGKHPKR
ncbi:MAG: agmatinase family protein [Cyclobacteriaceae bacterium]|nr:agmatinase family protein [Cyclobacteriaceae bacterium]MDW8331384.1 agmatinase family protein [Cyclobacteriaceae bacterium]